jgi:hypothetical protein
MAGPYNPPANGVEFVFPIVLVDAVTGRIKITPTIAAGDFKLSKAGGALANLTNLPAETPAGSGQVMITLTATEMTTDIAGVRWIDQTNPIEWKDGFFPILTTAP